MTTSRTPPGFMLSTAWLRPSGTSARSIQAKVMFKGKNTWLERRLLNQSIRVMFLCTFSVRGSRTARRQWTRAPVGSRKQGKAGSGRWAARSRQATKYTGSDEGLLHIRTTFHQWFVQAWWQPTANYSHLLVMPSSNATGAPLSRVFMNSTPFSRRPMSSTITRSPVLCRVTCGVWSECGGS